MKIEQTNKVCEVFLVSVLFEIPKDEAENCSLDAVGRVFGGRRDVEI